MSDVAVEIPGNPGTQLVIDQLELYKALDAWKGYVLGKKISELVMGVHHDRDGKVVFKSFHQNAKIMIVGETGSGKSYAGMSVAEDVGKWNSYYKYGDLDHALEFFDPKKNIAVIDPLDIQSLLKNADKPHNVYLVDDAAATWSNRKWMTKQNEILNTWFGIMRTNETVLILTVQSDKFIDVQARALFNWYIEMVGPHTFDLDTNFGKVFHTSLHPRHSRRPVHTTYPMGDGIKYALCGFVSPTKATTDAYNPLRARKVAEFTQAGFRELEQFMGAGGREYNETNTEQVADAYVASRAKPDDVADPNHPANKLSTMDVLRAMYRMNPNLTYDEARVVIENLKYGTFANSMYKIKREGKKQ